MERTTFTDTQLTSLTSYDFRDGKQRSQYIDGIWYKTINMTLFFSKDYYTWDIVGSYRYTDDYKYSKKLDPNFTFNDIDNLPLYFQHTYIYKKYESLTFKRLDPMLSFIDHAYNILKLDPRVLDPYFWSYKYDLTTLDLHPRVFGIKDKLEKHFFNTYNKDL